MRSIAEQATIASGVVFDDRSGTGRRRPGDPGIAGVMVSNGRDVVRTDADGRCRLPLAEGDCMFVIKPPHWSTPSRGGGLPQFSYLHHPRGTPSDLEYQHAGVAPTGPLPISIGFALQRRPEALQIEVLLLADTQPENGTELGYLRDDIIAGTLGCGAAFAINHGDIVFDDLALYPRYLEMLAATGIPWHHCPGNHDLNSEARDDRHSRETWKRVFGPRTSRTTGSSCCLCTSRSPDGEHMIAVGIAVRAVGEGNSAPVAGAAPPAAGSGGEDLVMMRARWLAIGSGQIVMLGQVHVA